VVLDAEGPATGRVFDIENHGVIKILTLDIDGTHLHATVSAQTKVNIDDVLKFSWKPDKVLFFNPSNGHNMDLS
jgi:multiple sugar transport system ATP-binding protein